MPLKRAYHSLNIFFGLTLCFLVLISTEADLKAQNQQGSELNGSKITLDKNTYIQYTQKKDGTMAFNSILSRSITDTTYDGKDSFLIIQEYKMDGGVDYDSSFVRSFDLKPLAYFTSINSGEKPYKESTLFLESRIKNTVIFRDSTSIKDHVKPDNTFYNGVIEDDLISGLPLEIGKEFTLRLINPGLRFAAYNATIKVDKKEEVSVQGIELIECWVVKVSYNGGETSSTEWYSVDTMTQIKTESEFRNGDKFIRVLIFS